MAAKLAKGFLGTNNFDTNSRLCMASAAVGYARSLGADGPPATYADLERADCFLLIGTNTADCHPIVFKRIRRRKLAAPDDVFVIVADPRWTETADLADLHLAAAAGLGHRAAERRCCTCCGARDCSTSAFIAEHTTRLGRRCARVDRRAIRRSARRRSPGCPPRVIVDGGAAVRPRAARR